MTQNIQNQNYHNDVHNNSHHNSYPKKEKKRFLSEIFDFDFNVKIFIYLRFVILLKL